VALQIFDGDVADLRVGLGVRRCAGLDSVCGSVLRAGIFRREVRGIDVAVALVRGIHGLGCVVPDLGIGGAQVAELVTPGARAAEREDSEERDRRARCAGG